MAFDPSEPCTHVHGHVARFLSKLALGRTDRGRQDAVVERVADSVLPFLEVLLKLDFGVDLGDFKFRVLRPPADHQ
jgi:hypothetical protein